jgi:pSer/pThr/pTyr-binding forkhead associated (FHA) protein
MEIAMDSKKESEDKKKLEPGNDRENKPPKRPSNDIPMARDSEVKMMPVEDPDADFGEVEKEESIEEILKDKTDGDYLDEESNFDERTDRIAVDEIKSDDIITDELPPSIDSAKIKSSVREFIKSETELPRARAMKGSKQVLQNDTDVDGDDIEEWRDTDCDIKLPANSTPDSQALDELESGSGSFRQKTAVEPCTPGSSNAPPADDDDSDEKTVVFSEGPKQQSRVPFLVVIDGQNEGREFDIDGDVVNMGRGPDNDLVFPDMGCSRRHAVIEKHGDKYVITDLGSGNGTVVNGKKIQRHQLKSADEIEIGSSVLQFVDPGERGSVTTSVQQVTSGPTPQKITDGLSRLLEDPRQRKLLVYGGIGVLGFLFLMLIIKLVVGSPETTLEPQESVTQKEQEAQATMERYLAEIKKYVIDKKWQEASVVIKMALEIDPTDKLAVQYGEFVEMQLASQKAFNEAKELMNREEFDQAATTLESVRPDSDYSEKAKLLKKEIKEKMIGSILNQGKQLLEEKSYEQAVTIFEKVLQEQPSHQEALLLKQKAEEEIALQERLALKAKKSSRKVKKQQRKAKTPKSSLSGRLRGLYLAGKLDEVVREAEKSKSTKVLGDLKKFAALYERGMELSKNRGQPGSAIKFLEKALKLDKKIGGGSGTFRGEIIDKLAKLSFFLGVDSYIREDYPKAYQSFKKVLKYQPDNERAKKRIIDLEKVAKRLFEEAYVVKSTSPDQALKNLNVVLKIVPKNSIYYQKSQRLKAEVQGPIGQDIEDSP